MKRIDFTKIMNISSTQKGNVVKNNRSFENDKFIKGSQMAKSIEEEYKEIIAILSRHKYSNISKALIEDNYWTDSLNFVGFNRKNNLIDGISIGTVNPQTAETDIKIVKPKAFMDIMTYVTANNIEKNTAEKDLFREEFKNLLSYICKNKIKE